MRMTDNSVRYSYFSTWLDHLKGRLFEYGNQTTSRVWFRVVGRSVPIDGIASAFRAEESERRQQKKTRSWKVSIGLSVDMENNDSEENNSDYDLLDSDEDREIVTLAKLKEFNEHQGGEENNNETDNNNDGFMTSTTVICGGLTAAILAAIYFWNETLGLDIVTMILTLVAIVYVWTNG